MSTGSSPSKRVVWTQFCVQSKKNRRPSNHSGNFVGDGLFAS